jgi:tetratricopeptide (TPR) repeat protein
VRRAVRTARLVLPLVLAFGCVGWSAHAQTIEVYRPRSGVVNPQTLIGRGQLTLKPPAEARLGPLSQRPIPSLGASQLEALGRARSLREMGRLDPARDSLQRLLATVPHHALVLWDLAAVERDQGDWHAVEQMAHAERGATGDSLLLAQEYAEALEKLGRARDAAEVVLEAWVAADYVEPWADATLMRLSDAGIKGLDQKVRAAAAARPWRADLGRAAARLAWRAGDARAALASLATLDRLHPERTPERWNFAEEMLATGSARDSAGALEALLDLTGDHQRDVAFRYAAARRAWAVIDAMGQTVTGAPRLTRALADRPPREWGNDLVIPVARGLRAAGLGEDARKLIADAGGDEDPELRMERALGELHESPTGPALETLHTLASVSPEATFRYAEGLFFAGEPDSAATWYGRMSRDATSPFTGQAFERLYLIEDADPKTALPTFGRMAWEEWRGEPHRALTVAESLLHALPRGALWAQAAIADARLRETTGDGRGALAPLMAVADSLPGDRLGPLACQRAGDVLRVYYKDDARALDMYETCLERYPKAWNSAEVRRRVETMRRERRF